LTGLQLGAPISLDLFGNFCGKPGLGLTTAKAVSSLFSGRASISGKTLLSVAVIVSTGASVVLASVKPVC
jgi:hypothetical protein